MLRQHLSAASELTAEGAERWYAARVAEANPHWWVIDLDGAMIGTASLHALSEQDRKARFAVGLMAPEYLDRRTAGNKWTASWYGSGA